jgi:hypothetical protein
MVVVNFLPAWNVTEMMVNLSVAGFISSDGQDHIPHHRILRQLVVVDGFLGGSHIGPSRYLSIIDCFEHHCVGVNCFFLKITNKSVAVSGTYAVKEEVSIEKDALSQSDQNSKRNSRVSLLQKEEKMHALVFRFLKKMMNPAMVTLKGAQAPQMTTHATNHSRHTSYCFQEYCSVQPVSLVHLVWVVTRKEVKAPASCLDGVI